MEFFTTFKGEGLNIGQKLKIKKVQSLKGQNGQNSKDQNIVCLDR